MFTKRGSTKVFAPLDRVTRARGLRATVAALAVTLAIATITTTAGPSAYGLGSPLRQRAPSVLIQTLTTSQRSYGPGTPVTMTWSVRNSSATDCAVATGPSSPSFTITNSRGAAVWNNCYSNDQPGPCPLYLMDHRLAAHASFAETFSWDQRSGATGSRVPTGTYRLRVQYGGLRSLTFALVARPTRTVVVTQAQSGTSVVVHIGERLSVILSGPTNYTWSDPVTSDQSVLERLSDESGAVASATFVGVAAGQVRVTAIDNPNCYPGCLAPSRLFTLSVTVTN